MDLSREQVRTKSGGRISGAYIEQIETGAQQRPSAEKLAVLAEVYEVDPLHLLKLAGYIGKAVKTRPPVPVGPPAGLVIAGREITGLTENDLSLIAQFAEHMRRGKTENKPQ